MTTLSSPSAPFVDRRAYDAGIGRPTQERRQFSNSHEELSVEARDLAQASARRIYPATVRQIARSGKTVYNRPKQRNSTPYVHFLVR